MKRRRKRANASGRTLGDAKHVRLHRWMLRSAAWQALPLIARCLLVELYDLYDGQNNGELFMSVREAARRLGIAANTAGRMFRELETKGFIRVRQKGSFDWKYRHATCWILTEFGFAGHLPTKDFMRWQPLTENQKPVSTAATDSLTGCDRRPSGPCENRSDGIISCDRALRFSTPDGLT